MESKNEERKKTSEELKLEADISKFTKWGWGFVIVGILFFIVGWVPFLYETEYGFNELGSYLGGTVGSLWALAGLFFIYVAFLGQKVEMIYQREELGYTREELKGTREELRGQREQMTLQNTNLQKQNFENTFFQLISLHNHIVEQLDIGSDPIGKQTGEESIINALLSTPKKTGRDCFEYFYEEYKSEYNHIFSLPENNNLFKPTYPDYESVYLELIQNSYSEFFKLYQSDIGHYFRNLYHIFKFIDNSQIDNKKFYSNIIRAQLSSYELLLLFYNCLSEKGYKKFKKLVEDYNILENIDESELISIDHKIPYNSNAFSDSLD